MATGQNIQGRRGIEVTPITPLANVDDGEGQLWGALGQLTDQLVEANTAQQVKRAEAAGAAEARDAWAKGEALPTAGLLAFGDVYEARTAAVERSYRSGIENDWDAQESEIAARNPHSLEEYERDMSALRSSFIEKADPQFAVQIEDYANRRITAGRSRIVERVQNVQLQEAALNIAGRYGALTTQMLGLARAGQTNTPEYEQLARDRSELQADRLANPAIPYGEAQAAEDEREFVVQAKAAVFAHHGVDLLRTEGPDAALGSLQGILEDPELNSSERQAAFEAARAAVNQEIDVSADRANMARTAQTRAEQEMQRRIDDSAAAIEIGAPDTGLTEAEVMAVKGPAGVAEWRRKQADAAQRNRLTGSLIGLSTEEATRRAMGALTGAGRVGSVEDLARPLDTPQDFDAFAAAIRMVETGNNPARVSADPDGAGPAAGGAVGAMQLLPGTARDAARRLGILYDENRLLTDVAYNEQLGREELRHLLSQYDGNAALAATAYHAGPGNVNAWLRPVGTVTMVEGKRVVGKGDPRTGEVSMAEWIDRIDRAGNPRSAAYPRKVAEALGGGQAAAEWRATEAAAIVTNATEGFASDPIQFAGSHRVAAVPPLTVDGVFSGGQAAEQWGEAMRARAAMGGNLAERYGVPLRHFTGGEAAAYRDRFERDPGAAVEFAREATRALGGRGARDALAEVGQNSVASTAIHIADLSTDGDTRFSDAAALGLTHKAAGVILAAPLREDLSEALQRYQTQFRNSPSLLQAITNSVEAAALADQVAGTARPASYYVQAAMGRSTWQGRAYGGSTDVNGATVLLPRWLNPERSEDALEALADNWAANNQGPVYPNDQPIPARDVARMRLVLMPNGRYSLVDRDGRAAYSRTGSPFQLDIEAGRDFLRRRLGNSGVRPD